MALENNVVALSHERIVSDKYHSALIKGRHPRSFPRNEDVLYGYLDSSEKRVKTVKTGRPLQRVVSSGGKTSSKQLQHSNSVNRIRHLARKKTMEASRSLSMYSIKAVNSQDSKKLTPRTTIRNLGTTRGGNDQVASLASIDQATALTNDFGSQSSARIHYGCEVALELFNEKYMMVDMTSGKIHCEKLDILNHQHGKHKVLFKLLNLSDLQSGNPIKYGDSVWLQIAAGPGDPGWENGSVLGARIREAPLLKTLPMSKQMEIRNPTTEVANVGFVLPLRAYVPKQRDEGSTVVVDDLQAKVRNKASRNVGRWTIRSALASKSKKDQYVQNKDEIYFEQDWFYIAADTHSDSAILRQLPIFKERSKVNEYAVERRAVWKVRLLDSNGSGSGFTLAQKEMEKVLYKAKNQLKNSQKMRDGEQKQYNLELASGSAFPRQLRRQIQNISLLRDEAYFQNEEEKLTQLYQYFESKLGASASPSREKEQVSTRRRSSVASVPVEIQSKKQPTIHCSLCKAFTSQYHLCRENVSISNAIQSEHVAMEQAQLLGQKLRGIPQELRDVTAALTSDEKSVNRVLELLREEDQKMRNVLKYKEHSVSYMQYVFLSKFRKDILHFTQNPDSKMPVLIPSLACENTDTPKAPTLLSLVDLAAHLENEYQEQVFEVVDEPDAVDEAEFYDPPDIDMDRALTIYDGSFSVLTDMLKGFAELCTSRVLPQLKAAVERKHVTSLLDTADFLARSSEFVAARKVQTRVVALLECASTCNAATFESVMPAYEAVVSAVELALEFIDAQGTNLS